MTLRLLPPLALGLIAVGLAGCGRSAAEISELRASCPQAMRVQDAASLTRFRPGTGRDRTDVLFQADLGNIDVACGLHRNRVDVDLTIEIVVAEGPALRERAANVGYFVRLIDPSGRVVQGRNFAADYKFAGNRTRAGSSEQLTLTIPLAEGQYGGGYTVAVGLLPTPEELEYNRRGSGTR
ncbi:MAG: hypothetical protein KIT36_07020 [Alphaproteobacteria bacterium]|nr:hypothetical protein [Alphaproteobacteria bacterium]